MNATDLQRLMTGAAEISDGLEFSANEVLNASRSLPINVDDRLNDFLGNIGGQCALCAPLTNVDGSLNDDAKGGSGWVTDAQVCLRPDTGGDGAAADIEHSKPSPLLLLLKYSWNPP